jgi:adenosylcobinamide-GDP ribazoletransferase
MMFGIRFMKYARPQGGLGTDFFSTSPSLRVLSSLVVPVFFSFWLGWTAIWFNGLFVAVTALILLYFKKRMDGITGDMLGSMTEVEEACLFLIASL